MQLKVGDQVKHIDEDLNGEIIKIIDDLSVVILSEEGFEYNIQCQKLVLNNNQYYTVDHEAINDKIIKDLELDFHSKNQKTKKEQSKNDSNFWEIDLHIHELVDYDKNLSNAEMLKIQLRHFERMMERAIKNKISRVVFIHGVGQGVLKHEIRLLLSTYPSIRYEDASYKEYGYGATEVFINYN